MSSIDIMAKSPTPESELILSKGKQLAELDLFPNSTVTQ